MFMKPAPPKRRNQRGYILITLMLFVALLAVASLAWIQKVDFEIKRDREEELIHRGVQYSRAIKRYVKKFGRYPARIEDLESTNHQRFLRKRYKDPITGKDFKLLHQNDVQISFSPGAASGMPPGAVGAFSAAQPGAPGGALSVNSNSFSSSGAGPSGPSSIPAGAQNGQQSASADGSNSGQAGQDTSTSNDSNNDSASQENASSNQGNQPNQNGPGNGPTFGGMPIVGVASLSKAKTIREFNKKDHYNQWQFIYDPSSDRGGLLTTPNQPGIQGATQVNQMNNNQPGNNGQNGQNPGLGGFGNQGVGQGGVNSPPPQQLTPQQPPDQ